MLRNVKVMALSILVLAALLACSTYSTEPYYHTSYKHSSYSYPVNYGYGCVQSRKTTKTTIKHPVYGKIKVKTTKQTTSC